MHLFVFAWVGHTLIVAVLAFFVLFAASKSDGFVRLLGNVLGWILLIAAVLGLVVGIFHVMTGKGPLMEGGSRWMMHWEHGTPPPGAPPPAAAPQTTPAQPAAPPTPPKKP
jgi:hypothetical protein